MSLPPHASSAIAVVGMAGRFPGARDIGQYWRNLCAGRESVVRFSTAELRAAGEDPEVLADPGYVRAGAPLDGIDLFDAGFFGFSARDASILDPQHRQFLEVCWEALEDAGHVPQAFNGAIGVFAGAGMHDYYVHHLAPNRRLMQDVGPFLVRHTGNDKDFLTTRVSYCLDLTGPSIGVQTACSTSLVAIHMAAQSLLNGECDMALAGGVTIVLPDRLGYVHRDGEILSPDGHCRPFDRAARGTLFGSGAGVVVLRRAEDAIRDGDMIHALIRGSAVNNDGRGKVSYLAPSLEGQARCAAEALAVAGIAGSSIGYVEAHGTGTPVGDPIEVAALTQAYGYDPAAPWRCRLGSVKGNVGHLDVAAGVASFIKATLAVEHGAIPPSLHFTAANPECRFDDGPFRVAADLTPWPGDGAPRRAAVNSLGVGGTNAHVILEAAPPRAVVPAAPGPQILCLSARSPSAVHAAARRLAGFLRERPAVALADVAHTLQVGRRAFSHRRAVVARDLAHAIALLEGPPSPEVGAVADQSAPVVFMFPGGGVQYPEMGRDLYGGEPEFRTQVDRVLEMARRHGHDVRRWLFPVAADAAAAPAALETAAQSLLATFAIEYGLAQLWRAKGVEPAAVIGHSLGEIVAACLAGVFSLDDAIALVAARAAILDDLPPGATMVVALTEAELTPLLPDDVAVAAVNGPALCVVAGAAAAIAALDTELAAKSIEVRRLRLAFAPHSPLLDGSLDGFVRAIAGVHFMPPRLPLVSNLTGKWADAAVASPDYWARHLRHTVRFADGLAHLAAELPGCVLLEVGPGTTLTTLAAQLTAPRRARVAVATMPHQQDPTPEGEALMAALGRLWAAGAAIDWQVNGARGRRIPLPTYPFEHARHWIDRPAAGDATPPVLEPTRDAQVPPRLATVDDWFSVPGWELAAPSNAVDTPQRWLVMADADPVHDAIAAALAVSGDPVVLVRRGAAYRAAGPSGFVVRPGHRSDFDRLLADLRAGGALPTRVVHLWATGPAAEPLEQSTEAAFDSLLAFAQAWAEADGGRLHVHIVTEGMQSVAGEPLTHPERALALGPALVVPKENDSLGFTCVDWRIDRPMVDPAPLVRELLGVPGEAVVALRGDARWRRTLCKATLPVPRPVDLPTCSGGVYLITGGLGHIGLTIAEHLARRADITLVMVGRRPPPTSRAEGAPADPGASVAERLRGLSAAGAAVEYVAADVAHPVAVAALIADVERRFGPVRGVVHSAGVLDDGPMQIKSLAAAHAVLAPKVAGTLALERALGPRPLDFFVLCSSTSTVLAPPGQVDYVAANAFLNAFAQARSASPHRVRAIGWAAWADGGMAVRAAAARPGRGAPTTHPLLGTLVQDGPSARVFDARYAPGSHWVLDQHRLADGTAVLPGSAYLELFRAAANEGRPSGVVHVQNLLLLAPLSCGDGDVRDVRVTLARDGAVWHASVSTKAPHGWIDHATATVRLEAPGTAIGATVDLEAVRQRCTVPAQRPDTAALQVRHLRFGPRWQGPASLRLGDGESLATCELPGDYATDLDVWATHPALGDLAMHAGLPLVTDGEKDPDLFVPLAVATVRIGGALPRRIHSHVRIRDRVGSTAGALSFDVTITDDAGRVLVDAEDLVLRRLGAQAPDTWTPPRRPHEPPVSSAVALGITAAEGRDVFTRMIAATAPPCAFASPLDLSVVTPPPQRPAVPAPDLPPIQQAARPRDDYERTVAGIWSELLGLPEVGIHDDFFALGGHSLIAVRLFARLRARYQVSLGLAVLFEAPTVAATAAILRERLGPAAETGALPVATVPGEARTSGPPVVVPMEAIRRSPCLVPIQPRGRRRPLFVFPGIGGNVLGFQALLQYLSDDQPVIGLQSLGLVGDHQPLTSLPEIAARFVRELTAVQPTGPYRFGGFSFGGVVALEAARQLQAAGQRVELLALFDTLLERASAAEAGVATHIVRVLAFWRRRVAHHARAVLAADRPLDYFERKIRTLRRRFGTRVRRDAASLQRALHGDDVTDLLPGLRRVRDANVHAIKRYVPQRYGGPLVLFRAEDRGLAGPIDSDENWRDIGGRGLRVIPVPGNHLSMMEPPHVAVIGAALEACLLELEPQSAAGADGQPDAVPVSRSTDTSGRTSPSGTPDTPASAPCTPSPRSPSTPG